MSRRSLRLDDGLLDRSLPLSSASFSVGGASWRSSRSVRSRRSQQFSSSCSESLLLSTPCKQTASDASLLSSLLETSSIQDTSSIQETSLGHGFWGLDHDVDPRESTVLADRTLIGSEPRQSAPSRVYCRDCELPSASCPAPSSCHASSSCSSSPSEPASPETTVIYSRTRSHRSRTGGAAGDVITWLHRRWRHTGSSFLQLRPQYRCLLLLLLVLLPLLLLCSFHPAALHSLLPAAPAGWRTPLADLTAAYSQSEEGAAEEAVESSEEEALHGLPLGDETASSAVEAAPGRLVRLEQTVAALWERVEAGGGRAEQRRQAAAAGDGDAWIDVLVEQKVEQLRLVLEEELRRREEVRKEQRSHTSRLDQLEQQLQTLAADAQEALQRQEAAAEQVPPPSAALPAAVSVDRHSHEALQAQVARLEALLEDARRDVDGLIRDTTAEQLSAQVRDEVRSLVFGNQPMAGGVASGGVLQWLARRFVSGVELEASLSALELKVLQNVSQQQEQQEQQEQQRPPQDAMSREDVHALVEDALRRFAQDRTGMADYALESGGGSILSTRCSETYRTEAALLSLFGVPLWYFSQSPRAVIQPEVHPGNCWAFRGSLGFLVIRLSMRILPSSFTLEHIPKSLAPSGSLLSAPRDFSVYGLEDLDQDSGTLLGSFTYDQDGDALQTFRATDPGQQSFQIVEVRILSNWGHPDYTCMYRFRVHGTPRDP